MRSLTHKNSPTRRTLRRPRVLLLSVACSLCLTALVFVFEAAPAAGQAKATGATVVVTLGSPNDQAITLSSQSVALVGTATTVKVTFKVTNRGKKPHSFEVCTAPTSSTKANSCDGTATKVLAPGKTGSFTATLKQGTHEYLSSVKGDANAGMRGGLKVAPPIPDAVKVTLDDGTIFLSEGLVGLGPVTFNVTNKGKKKHDFQICYQTTYAAVKNICLIGAQTKVLAHGQSAMLTVTLEQGIHEYLSTVDGDAKGGMKGGLDVEPIATPPATTTTQATDTTCANPTASDVTVTEIDYAITVSPTTVPCGTITFTITNNSGQSTHSFDIVRYGTVRVTSGEINPGTIATLKVVINPGTHSYQSDDPVDVYQGMMGVLTVTG